MHEDDLKEKDEFILFFKSVLGKISSAARILINSSLQTEATTFAFSSVCVSFYEYGTVPYRAPSRYTIGGYGSFDVKVLF